MYRQTITVALLLFTITTAVSQAADDSWIGRKVFWKSEARLRVGDTDVDPKLVDWPALVTQENGDWLWIGQAWLRKSDTLTADQALDYFNEKVKQNPSDAASWSNRAAVWNEKGNLDNAISDYSEAIRLNRLDAAAFTNRGLAWQDKGDYAKAISDLSNAIGFNTRDPAAYNHRAEAWTKNKEYDNALHDLNEALRLDPQNAVAFNNSAWLRATCADARYRDGTKAVANATRACELTNWKVSQCIGTLGAAYAEQGDFDQAVKWQAKAIDLATDDKEKQEGRRLLDFFKSGEAFHGQRHK